MRSVGSSKELRRVLGIERRQIPEDDLHLKLTQKLRRPGGTWVLRPLQAHLLFELAKYRGAFGWLQVGEGKTPPAILFPECVQAERPLLVVPGALLEKTRRDIVRLSQHFYISDRLRLESYEKLSQASGEAVLSNYQPDWLAFDEAHNLKNRKAAVTKKVLRYFDEHPDANALFLTGTLSQRSLHEYEHLFRIALRERCPLPESWYELGDWSSALGVEKRRGMFQRVRPGKLSLLCNGTETGDELSRVRQAYARRLRETPGIVASTGQGCEASLRIKVTRLEMPENIKEAIKVLKAKGATPDGWTYSEASTIWGKTRELAIGFYYVWVPRPSPEYLEARSAWATPCRHVISTNRRRLDSEGMVKQAVREGQYPEMLEPLLAWEAATYEGKQEGRWLSPYVRDYCVQWAKEPGIIWTQHIEFAQKLAEDSGIPYYGADGLAPDGRFIEDHPPDKPLIASIDANGEGRNLQAWNRALFVSFPPNGSKMEQAIGREHRPGQLADTVYVELLVTCEEHEQALRDLLTDARYQQETSMQPQKVLFADWENEPTTRKEK